MFTVLIGWILCLTTADLSGTLLLMKSSAQESKSGDGAMLEFDFLSSKEAEKFRKNQRSWTKLKIGGKKLKLREK